MIRYLLKLSRPRFWLYLAGPVLVGVAYGAPTIDDLFSVPAVALFAYFLLPANVFLYGINDIFDADIDEENPKKDEQEVRYRGSKVVPIAVVLSVLLGLGLLVITPTVAWPWLLGFLFLGAGYSAPPLRLKTTPLLDSISNGLYILPGAAAYAALSGSHPPLLAVIGGWLWAMAMHTFSAIPDIEPDEKAGIRTTATMLGERQTLAYCAGCWLLSAVLFGLLDPRAGLLLLCYPALVAAWVARDVAIDRAYWWYPAINTVVGMVLTFGGLWRVVRG
ncbi:4-hydroxybenzoate polyprenyltransferase [Haladaptatus litoreus]|uniref:4-hydroxybenzoate polyprenyltransferase n=1 Tax=Haladaptatus litoreus TaxID=553468 RepID=A0A1N6X419_9EURY|nr:prenyltransferase [Haladaptatus litoreus]SIQ97098.1 4-hydroxybenzoate polyprenyltransferase [Haladaptatus litoreus]